MLPVELDPMEFGGERYRPDPAAPEATLTLTRAGAGTLFALALATTLRGPCFRCLASAAVPVEVHVREYDEPAPGRPEELRNPYLEDDLLDLSAWARDAIALELPEKILCREDCAGLCAGCGANLNEEACRCGPPAPDPRFEKLAEMRERLEG